MLDQPAGVDSMLTFLSALGAGMLIMIGLFEFRHRRFEAKLERRWKETDSSLVASHGFIEDVRARSESREARSAEVFALQRRAVEIAEQAREDRQEMVALLHRIVGPLESRSRP